MNSGPVLFLDVDGVLNPEDDDGLPAAWQGTWRCMHSPSGIRVWLSSSQASALRRLPVEIVWATTWCHSPDDLEWLCEELGFPYGMPRLTWRPYEDTSGESCGKRPGIERFLAGTTRPAVWLDDQIGPDDLDFVERRRQVAPIEAFVPKSREGVDEDTVAAIAAFLERHRSQSV
jgi:hypothetical protein